MDKQVEDVTMANSQESILTSSVDHTVLAEDESPTTIPEMDLD